MFALEGQTITLDSNQTCYLPPQEETIPVSALKNVQENVRVNSLLIRYVETQEANGNYLPTSLPSYNLINNFQKLPLSIYALFWYYFLSFLILFFYITFFLHFFICFEWNDNIWQMKKNRTSKFGSPKIDANTELYIQHICWE